MQSLIKLDPNDAPLPDSAEKWAAVHDPNTGLIWAAGTLGDKRLTFADAKAAVKKLGNDWRLPTIRELLSLVDYDRHAPAINTEMFPDARSAAYWSSSSPPYAGDSGYSWVVNFGYGNSFDVRHGNAAFVRPVRSAPAGAGQ